MALINKTLWFNNIPCTYHRIIGIDGDANEEPVENGVPYNGQTMIEVASYVDKATRDERKLDFVIMRPFTIPQLDVTRAQAYAYLQTLEEFEGAESDE